MCATKKQYFAFVASASTAVGRKEQGVDIKISSGTFENDVSRPPIMKLMFECTNP